MGNGQHLERNLWPFLIDQTCSYKAGSVYKIQKQIPELTKGYAWVLFLLI